VAVIVLSAPSGWLEKGRSHGARIQFFSLCYIEGTPTQKRPCSLETRIACEDCRPAEKRSPIEIVDLVDWKSGDEGGGKRHKGRARGDGGLSRLETAERTDPQKYR
jgi:hypothetical protein